MFLAGINIKNIILYNINKIIIIIILSLITSLCVLSLVLIHSCLMRVLYKESNVLTVLIVPLLVL